MNAVSPLTFSKNPLHKNRKSLWLSSAFQLMMKCGDQVMIIYYTNTYNQHYSGVRHCWVYMFITNCWGVLLSFGWKYCWWWPACPACHQVSLFLSVILMTIRAYFSPEMSMVRKRDFYCAGAYLCWRYGDRVDNCWCVCNGSGVSRWPCGNPRLYYSAVAMRKNSFEGDFMPATTIQSELIFYLRICSPLLCGNRWKPAAFSHNLSLPKYLQHDFRKRLFIACSECFRILYKVEYLILPRGCIASYWRNRFRQSKIQLPLSISRNLWKRDSILNCIK